MMPSINSARRSRRRFSLLLLCPPSSSRCSAQPSSRCFYLLHRKPFSFLPPSSKPTKHEHARKLSKAKQNNPQPRCDLHLSRTPRAAVFSSLFLFLSFSSPAFPHHSLLAPFASPNRSAPPAVLTQGSYNSPFPDSEQQTQETILKQTRKTRPPPDQTPQAALVTSVTTLRPPLRSRNPPLSPTACVRSPAPPHTACATLNALSPSTPSSWLRPPHSAQSCVCCIPRSSLPFPGIVSLLLQHPLSSSPFYSTIRRVHSQPSPYLLRCTLRLLLCFHFKQSKTQSNKQTIASIFKQHPNCGWNFELRAIASLSQQSSAASNFARDRVHERCELRLEKKKGEKCVKCLILRDVQRSCVCACRLRSAGYRCVARPRALLLHDVGLVLDGIEHV